MEIKIRPLEEKDAYTSVHWRNIPEIWQHTGFKADKKITIENELEWIRKVTKNPTEKRFAILADNVYVGNTYLTDMKNKQAEFHIFIGDQDYWGKGIARKATNLVLSYAKQTLKLNKVNLGVKKENTAAFHIYETLGFKEKGNEDGFVRMTLDLKQYNSTQ